MPDEWFNVPETGTGTATDPHRPDLPAVEAWGGNRLADAPRYIVRVWAAQTTLDSLAGRDDADRLADQATAMSLLNDRSDATLTTASRLFADR